MKNQNTRRLVESALMIAIGTVLSELKVGSLWAFGGGLTIGSMVPLVLISHRWGIKWGTFTAFVYSLLQLILVWIMCSTPPVWAWRLPLSCWTISLPTP